MISDKYFTSTSLSRIVVANQPFNGQTLKGFWIGTTLPDSKIRSLDTGDSSTIIDYFWLEVSQSCSGCEESNLLAMSPTNDVLKYATEDQFDPDLTASSFEMTI